uniref:Uncharacterized protein n=1 Tax=Meloidogyne enterolobii TaxID=390850 RepID=A0A6V7TQ39_MELEN|nr:unnamed protein product [Meloidogyne enterolobii]
MRKQTSNKFSPSIFSIGKVMSDYNLNRSRSAAIFDSKSLFAYPISKTYSVPNISDYSINYTLYHGLKTYDIVRPTAYTTYRSYFPYKNYEPNYLNNLYWNDKPTYYSNSYNRVLQPRHYTDHMKSPYFLNHSCTYYPFKYNYNDFWYGYKTPSYYRNYYYVSPYYDYYSNNTYNYRYNYR